MRLPCPECPSGSRPGSPCCATAVWYKSVMDRKRIAALLLLAALPGVAVAGCSSSTSSSSESSASPTASVSVAKSPTAAASSADPAGVGMASASAEIQAKIDCQVIRADADKLDLAAVVSSLDLASDDKGAAALQAIDQAKSAATTVVAKLGTTAPASSPVYLAQFTAVAGIIKDGEAKGQTPDEIQAAALAAASAPGVQQSSAELTAAVDAKCPPESTDLPSPQGSGDYYTGGTSN